MSDERFNLEVETADLSFHITKADGQYETWFNFDGNDYSGFIVGLGATRDESVADAVKTLEAAVAKLQEPPQ